VDVGNLGSRVDGVAGEDGELVTQCPVGELRHVATLAPLGLSPGVRQPLQDGTHAPGRGDAVRPRPPDTVPQRHQPVGQTPELALDVVPAGRSGAVDGQSLPRRIASSRRISRYSHTSVTTRPNAAIHA